MIDPPIFHLEIPIKSSRLDDCQETLKANLQRRGDAVMKAALIISQLGVMVYGKYSEYSNGIFFRFPSLTISQSLREAKKLLKIVSKQINYSEPLSLSVSTICPSKYKDEVEKPELFSEDEISEFVRSNVKLLSYKAYLIWHRTRRIKRFKVLQQIQD